MEQQIISGGGLQFVPQIAAENIDIKLTAVPPTEGAFLQGASESVFEDKNKILLA